MSGDNEMGCDGDYNDCDEWDIGWDNDCEWDEDEGEYDDLEELYSRYETMPALTIWERVKAELRRRAWHILWRAFRRAILVLDGRDIDEDFPF
jgi:hypothetical protein